MTTTTEAPAIAEPAGAPLQLFTTSSAKKFRRCRREYQISNVLGFASVESANALRFGSLIHLGLEAWWKATDPAERLPAALAALQPRPGEDVDPFDLVRVEELLVGYDARWGGEPLVALAVEVEFRAPLINPETGKPSRTFQRAGKCDGIVQLQNGDVHILEHKTTSDDITPGSDYWRQLMIDDQVSNYFVGARSLGYDVTGCLYDVLAKPRIQPRAVPLTDDDGAKIVHDASGARVRTKDGKKWRETGDSAQGFELQTRPEALDEFRLRFRETIIANPNAVYQRYEVVRLEAEETEAAYDTWDVAKELLAAQNAGRWPRYADACRRFNRTCEFFDVCTRAASLDDPTRFKRKAAHSELSVPSATSQGVDP